MSTPSDGSTSRAEVSVSRRRRFLHVVGLTGTSTMISGCLGLFGDDDDDIDTDDEPADDIDPTEGSKFEVTAFSPERVTAPPNETVEIEASVSNVGDEQSSQIVELRLDNDEIDFELIALAPDETVTMSFSLTVPVLAHGDYEFGIYTEDDNATGTLTIEEVELQQAPLLADLRYEYYENVGTALPSFADMDPVMSDELANGIITLDPRQQDDDYGFVFEGKLEVGTRLDEGAYTFVLESNPISRLVINDETVVEGSDESGSTTLTAGVADFRLEYADPDGAQELGVGWQDTFDQLLGRICEFDPLRSDSTFDYEVEVIGRPAAKRMLMPNSSPRSLSVGVLPNTNFCFDVETASVQFAWRGAFLDFGPMIDYEGGRAQAGGGVQPPGVPLGSEYSVGGTNYALRIGSASAEPSVQFLGFQTWPHPPELHYRVDGVDVRHTVDRVPGQFGLSYEFELAGPDEPVYFLTDPDAPIDRDASIGEWDDGVLEVPADVSSFGVTIVAPGGGT